jgi:gamma-glutamylaminecyclotransferase
VTASIFVYGTLQRGRANHHVLADLGARFIRSALSIAPRTLVVLGPNPPVLRADSTRDASATCVRGEIHEIDDAALTALDIFEGCPTLFAREPITLTTDAGDIEAFVYVLALTSLPPHARIVTTGIYESTGRALPDGAAAVRLDEK